MRGSGNLKILPKVSFILIAISRVISMCCFWSLPTGTTSLS